MANKFEVFISFRGEDTRNNFVSHLHSALKDRGIRTYFDETNLQKGQTIGIELVKAIEGSSIAIVVLSSNYGSSTWCLNELVKIMECKNKSSLIVFPIFYHVDPSDVRKQKNSFFQAFSSHHVNFKDDGQKVNTWREALTQLANLSGEEIRGQNEASCIKKITDKILMQLPVKASEFRKSFVGIESRISEIKKIMKTKLKEVLFIGLWGMGGIGKTTTARAIFEDCKDEFEGSCFLQDVKENKNKMQILQQHILSNVLKTEFESIRDVVTGSSMIQERLQFKKVLLVIDDVDDVEQLNVLAKQCNWFRGGSRIIITTRDAHLINEDHIEKYDVQTLHENEALHLFCLHAFKDDHPPENFKELSLEVLRYAGGLPLALRVLGRHLYRRGACVWESTLNRLKDLPDDEIISRLQISFDGLSALQQNIFLDIACFFRGYSKGEVEERLDSLGLHPKEGIVVLIQKSLIHINHGNRRYNDDDVDQHRYRIEMHDLLQEMGWYIVRKRSNWDVRRYNRVWLEKDISELLSDTAVSSEVERICIHHHINRFHDNDSIQTNLGWEVTFRNMNKLSFLDIVGDFFKGNYNVNVSQPFGQLGNKLKWFSWRGYPGKSLPKSFHPKNLVHLHMEYSQINETPDFSSIPNLEVLNLSHSYMLVHVHSSLGNHMKIKYINLTFCKKLEEFPKIDHMKSLKLLDLSFTDLQSFPKIYGNLDCLRKLELRETSINGLPSSIVGNATGLQKLILECCCWPYKEEFTSLEVVAKSFPELVSLEVTYSGIMRTLDFSHLPYLEELNLSFSNELVEVHASLGVHKRIKSIKLASCSKLEEFPRIVSMDSLEELDLSYTYFPTFPEIYCKLDSLMTLTLVASGIVRTMDFSHLPYLEKLDLSNSKKLVEIHASLGVHKRIKSIELKNCFVLEEFPTIVDMDSLETLNLCHTRLQSFPEMTGNVNCLVRLNLDRTKIKTLPWSVGSATNLEFISMQDCEYLLTLPISFLGLQLQRIYIASRSFKYFKENIDDEAASTKSKRQKQFIGSEGMGQILESQIYFRNCKNLEELPESLLSRIEVLVIKDCPILTSWICFNLVDLLDKYQHLCYLKCDKGYEVLPHDYFQAFSEQEPMFNMLQKREKPFKVYIPRKRIPSWFQYQFSRCSVTVFLPPLFEWDTNKLRGFVISSINVDLKNKSMLSTYDHLDDDRDASCFSGSLHAVVMYITIDNIRRDIGDWDGQNECSLLELNSKIDFCSEMVETSPTWGLSLVYNKAEGNEIDPYQIIIVTNDCPPESNYATFSVKIAQSRDRMEKLYMDYYYQGKNHSNNPISWALLQQQSHLQAGTSAMAQNLVAPDILPLFASGPDLTCYQEGEPCSVCHGKDTWDADSGLELKLSLNCKTNNF